MSLPIRRTRACACAGFRVSPAHRAVAASIAFRNRAMFLAFRSCRAIANDDTFGWLRANVAIDWLIVSSLWSHANGQSMMMHTHVDVGGGW